MRSPWWMMVLCVLAASTWVEAAQAPPKDLVKASLIADTTAITPGQAFRVGVVLEVKPDWHIYWKNAGETGLPTEVSFTAPEGFEVGAVQYPVPEKFVQPGEIAGFGYTGKVMFIVSVMSPPTLSTAAPVTINANVSYLACEKVCLPGQANAQVTLSVSPAGQPAQAANADEFTQWKARVPVVAGASQDVATVNVSEDNGRFTVTVDWKDPVTQIEWFPAAEAALNVTEPKVARNDKQSILQFNAAVLQGQKLESQTMPLVLAFTDSQGERRGIEVSVPLDSIGKN